MIRGRAGSIIGRHVTDTFTTSISIITDMSNNDATRGGAGWGGGIAIVWPHEMLIHHSWTLTARRGEERRDQTEARRGYRSHDKLNGQPVITQRKRVQVLLIRAEGKHGRVSWMYDWIIARARTRERYERVLRESVFSEDYLMYVDGLECV